MPTISKTNFFDTAEGAEIVRELHQMEQSDGFVTLPSYSANTELYSDNLMPFVDKHVSYLKSHPSTNPQHYISNLRMMTRIR